MFPVPDRGSGHGTRLDGAPSSLSMLLQWHVSPPTVFYLCGGHYLRASGREITQSGKPSSEHSPLFSLASGNLSRELNARDAANSRLSVLVSIMPNVFQNLSDDTYGPQFLHNAVVISESSSAAQRAASVLFSCRGDRSIGVAAAVFCEQASPPCTGRGTRRYYGGAGARGS